MKNKLVVVMIICIILCSNISFANKADKLVIAHRGASGYLPEHTLEAKAMAYAMGAHYLEQDVVMTKDNKLIVLHDRYLDRVTNVAKIYPQRKREDGRYYAIDFDLEEIKGLKFTEGFNLNDGKEVQNYKGRFPMWKSTFKIHTLEEEIELIQGLNYSMKKDVGIYVEIKAPWFHKREGKDISREVLRVLKEYGYEGKKDKAYIQCFDPNETMRIKYELYDEYEMNLKLIQLMAETSWNETMEYKNGKWISYDYDWMFEDDGMKKVSSYADGIGPYRGMIVRNESTKDNLITTNLVKNAHEVNMEVHPYTFRIDEGRIPKYASDFNELLDIFYNKLNVDGIFTDYPDKALEFLKK